MWRRETQILISAAATSCVTARESLSLSESPFSVREVGEDRGVSRIPSSYLVSNGLTPQQPWAGTLAELKEKPSARAPESSRGLAPQPTRDPAGQRVLRVFS